LVLGGRLAGLLRVAKNAGSSRCKRFVQEKMAFLKPAPQEKGEELMKSRMQKLGFALLALVLGAGITLPSAFAAEGKTFTGTVSDAKCGAKHAMPGDPAGCTRACVAKGSKYALVVGDKVYSLETSDKTALATLDEQAGAKATVTGTEKDSTIAVTSVTAAK
jgi:hypothetical protein